MSQNNKFSFMFNSITPLIKFINKKKGLLQNEDMHQYLEDQIKPQILIEKIEAQKLREPLKDSQSINRLFRKILSRDLFKMSFFLAIWKMIGMSEIYLLDLTTESITQYTSESNQYKPIGYMFLMLALFQLQIYIDARYNYHLIILQCKLTIIAQYTLYDKSLKTKIYKEKEENENGDDDETKKPNIYNLMSVDAKELLMWPEGVMDCIIHILIQVIACIIQLVVACLFIYLKLGNSIWKGFVVLGIALVFNTFIMYSFLVIICIIINKKLMQKQLKYKDERISLSTDIIDCIKSIKYLGWESLFEKKIMNKRKSEYKMLTAYKLLDALLLVFWNSISYILLCAFLVGYINDGHALGDTNVFSLIAVFNYMTYPLGILPDRLQQISQGLISFGRIKSYLMQEDIDKSLIKMESYDSKKTQAIHLYQKSYQWPIDKDDEQIDNEQSNQQIEDQLKQSLLNTENTNNQSSKFTLKVKDLQIKKGTLNFIIGIVGSGKSALLNVILNEMNEFKSNKEQYSLSVMSMESRKQQLATFNNGEVNQVNGKVGYVSQNPWVQNKSIKDNILFGMDYDQKLYLECLNMSSIMSDINSFEQKDLKKVGPEGKSISGGQRQRITICRALYQRCDIFVFDDIFSSLDVNVADNLFHCLICSKIYFTLEPLIQQGKTIIFVTSHYKYIDLNQANVILLENGEIIQDLSVISEYIRIHDKEEDQQESSLILDKKDSIESLFQDKKSLLTTKLSKKQSSQKSLVIEKVNHKVQDDDEEREEGEISRKTLISYFKSMTWTCISMYGITLLLTQLTRGLVDFWLKSYVKMPNLYNQLNQDDQFDIINKMFNYNFSDIFVFLISVTVLVISINSAFYIACNLISSWSMFKKLNKSIMYAKMPFFDTNQQGRIINRLSNDTLAIDDQIPLNAAIMFEFLMKSFGYPIAIIILIPWASIAVFIIIILFYLLLQEFRKSNRDLKRINSMNEGQVLTHLNESIGGVKTIRAFGRENYFIDTYIKISTDTMTSTFNSDICFCWLGTRLCLLSNFLFFVVVVLITIFIAFDFEANYYSLALALTYAVLTNDQFLITIHFFCITEKALISVERVTQYFKLEQEIISNQKLGPSSVHIQPINPFTQTNDQIIQFQNVSMNYGATNNAISQFSLEIKKNQKVAICGRTGSGKSSIINLLFRLYDHQEGEVFFNGQNTRDIPLQLLRSQLSIVPQFGFLYNDSVRENLDPDHKFTEQCLLDLIEKHDLSIRNLRGKDLLDFQISQGGENLSNGEKQIINCVRVLLQDRQVVCLDEATSNMDPKTDKKIHDILFEFTKDKTLIVITHRLENIDLFDCVVVMDKGQVSEIGHVSELRQIQGGFFNKLSQ